MRFPNYVYAKLWIIVLAAATNALAQPVARQHVEFEALFKQYSLESPLKIALKLVNSENPYSLACNDLGIPDRLSVYMYDAEGKRVSLKDPGEDGLHLNQKEMYILQPFESLQFAFDLNHLFDINAGHYSLEIKWDARIVKKQEIEIVKQDTKAVYDLVGSGMRHNSYPNFAPLGGPELKSRLTHSSGCSATGLTLSTLTMNDCIFDKSLIPLHLRYSVEKEIEVKQIEMDCAWQVWTLLKSGEEQALLVWNLRQARVIEVLPWSKREIEMGAMAASRSLRGAKTVIAGLKGETKFSTSTVESWWEASLRSEKFK